MCTLLFSSQLQAFSCSFLEHRPRKEQDTLLQVESTNKYYVRGRVNDVKLKIGLAGRSPKRHETYYVRIHNDCEGLFKAHMRARFSGIHLEN